MIAYHSAEDRIVKNRLRDAARGCICPPQAPVCTCGGRVRLRVLTKRPVARRPRGVDSQPALALRPPARRRARGGGRMSATVRARRPADLVGARLRARARVARGSPRAGSPGWSDRRSRARSRSPALRIDILRMRYALGEAIREEKALRRSSSGRRPPRSRDCATRRGSWSSRSERGFAPPERVIDLRKSSRSPQGREAAAQRGEAERSVGPREGSGEAKPIRGGRELR